MAKGLRKDFEKNAKLLLPVALSRINDKSVWKPNALIERVEQLLWSLPFEFLLEELRPHIASKSLFAKKEALKFLLQSLDLPPVQLNCPDACQRFLAPIAAAVLPLIDDSDNYVRQEAAKLLATVVFRNKDSAEANSIILEKWPSHRRTVFDDEWKKIAKDLPSPLPSGNGGSSLAAVENERSVGSVSASAPGVSRKPSPLRTRLGSPGRAAKADETPAADSSTPKAAAGGRRISPFRSRGTLRTPETVVSVASAPSAETTELMRQMAEEIKSLRSKVERMEAERAETKAEGSVAPAAAPAPSVRASTTSRLRAPSGGRNSGEGEPSRVLTASSDQARPSTPRRTRESSTDRRDATPTRLRRDATPTRRDATPTRLRRQPAGTQVSVAPMSARLGGSSGSSDVRLSKDSLMWAHTLSEEEGGLPAFRIAMPKMSRQARQCREKSQYWGPDQIPAEHLAALKEAWRQSLDERLWKAMFSERMEEQLAALQSWKRQCLDYFDTILETEVLDMLLKWITWVLSNPNTQVWKLVLDVLGTLLEKLISLDMQLTERETQILVPTIVERSGHNIVAIREIMFNILGQCIAVCPKLRILPLLLHGLSSKSKRSAACSMRALGDALDRSTVGTLVRSQKDLSLVLKMTEDKDAEIRRWAINAVAVISLYLDDDAFARACRGLPASARAPVRAAAVKLDAHSSSIKEDAHASSVSGPSRRRSGGGTPAYAQQSACSLPDRRKEVSAASKVEGTRPCSPARSVQRSPSASPAPSPSKGLLTPCDWRASSPLRTTRAASPSKVTPNASPLTTASSQRLRLSASPVPDMPSGGNLSEASTRELIARLQRFAAGGGQTDEFASLCALLAERSKSISEADVSPLVENLSMLMQVCFESSGKNSDRCGSLLLVLDEICASKDSIRSLPVEPLRRLLKELLRFLDNSAWAKHASDGQQLLRKLNLSCVMLLNGLSRLTAYTLLFDLGLEESEVIGGSLIVKCMRKLSKGLPSSKNPELEVQAILDIVHQWLEKAARRGDHGGRAFTSVAAGAKEVVEAILITSPDAAAAWSKRLGEKPGDAELLQGWLQAAPASRPIEKDAAARNSTGQVAAELPSPSRSRRSMA
eukprot:TRINITY_DN12002_c0_g1_i1.p1 TRINITY_DN12002_c0_g1~~TRINITY_DN12002_c0_g1_i1.p1  ORF type:complete len:1130 (+),score=268.61 TRINITY_DN12002_c0_g1_i1:64-3390(+)